MLGIGLIDGHDRVAQDALLGHAAQANHACCRLLGPADHAVQQLSALGVEHGHQVGAIVHGHVRPRGQRLLDVAVVGRIVFTFDGECGDAELAGECRRDVVLRGQWVGRAQVHARATLAQREH